MKKNEIKKANEEISEIVVQQEILSDSECDIAFQNGDETAEKSHPNTAQYITAENYISIEANEKKKQTSEFEMVSKKYNTYFIPNEKTVIIIIGKKLPKQYDHVKNVNFGNTGSCMDDSPEIITFVETFTNQQFILLNVDDIFITPNVIKAFKYLAVLATKNPIKNFIVFSEFSVSYNQEICQSIKKILDLCKKSGNMIYISSAGDQGIEYKNMDYRLPILLSHHIKLCIGSLDLDSKISTKSNRGILVDYYAYGGNSTSKASLHVLLLTNLLWFYYPSYSAAELLNKLQQHSIKENIKILDLYYTISLIEKEFFRQSFVLCTEFIKDAKPTASIEIASLNVSFDLHLDKLINEKLFEKPMDIFPPLIKLRVNIKNDNYDFKIINEKINNTFQQKIELRKDGIGKDKKETLCTAPFQYDLNREEVSFRFRFKESGVVINIGTNNEIYFEQPFLLAKINKIYIQKADEMTYFKNLFVTHTTKSVTAQYKTQKDFDLLIQYEDEDQWRHALGQCFKHIDTGNPEQLAGFLNKNSYKQGLDYMFFSNNAPNKLEPIEALNLFTQILDDSKTIQLFSKEQRDEKKEQISGLIKTISDNAYSC